MTAYDGYQWFMPAWFTVRWWDTEYFNKMSQKYGYMAQESVPCTTSQMQKAVQGNDF